MQEHLIRFFKTYEGKQFLEEFYRQMYVRAMSSPVYPVWKWGEYYGFAKISCRLHINKKLARTIAEDFERSGKDIRCRRNGIRFVKSAYLPEMRKLLGGCYG